jgi:hypothetical protein
MMTKELLGFGDEASGLGEICSCPRRINGAVAVERA